MSFISLKDGPRLENVSNSGSLIQIPNQNDLKQMTVLVGLDSLKNLNVICMLFVNHSNHNQSKNKR